MFFYNIIIIIYLINVFKYKFKHIQCIYTHNYI